MYRYNGKTAYYIYLDKFSYNLLWVTIFGCSSRQTLATLGVQLYCLYHILSI